MTRHQQRAPAPRARRHLSRSFGALALVAAAALALAGCDDDADLPEDPPLRVPGHETLPDAPQLPPGMTAAMANAPTEEPDPPLAVPGYETLPEPPAPPTPQGVTPGGPIQLAPGFQPDPVVTRGVAGGPVAAAGMNPECVGYIAQQPSHVVQLAESFAALRVVVSSEQDTTLVIRGPQGEFRCNDDHVPGQDVNPLVAGAFGPGAYSVWVGSYAQGGQAPYAIGFSEIPSVTAIQVAQAAQQLPAPPQQPMQPQ